MSAAAGEHSLAKPTLTPVVRVRLWCARTGRGALRVVARGEHDVLRLEARAVRARDAVPVPINSRSRAGTGL
jgi:hypothetical protein